MYLSGVVHKGWCQSPGRWRDPWPALRSTEGRECETATGPGPGLLSLLLMEGTIEDGGGGDGVVEGVVDGGGGGEGVGGEGGDVGGDGRGGLEVVVLS